jgi:putative OPT family oligopeptide transporter
VQPARQNVPNDRAPVAEQETVAYKPYVPPEQSPRELTARALVLGSILGILFAASSVYLAVKVGLTVSASIPVAVLSIAIFRFMGKSSILENTIVQTTGSAGESLAFGIAAALPALLFLGYDIDLWHAFLVAAFGGVLGVLMMIPLRHGLIVQEHGKLAYPEGTACADVLIVGEQGGTNARTVITGFLIGAIYKFSYKALKIWNEIIGAKLGWATVSPSTGATVRHGYLGGSVSAEISPELLGVGYIIGPRVGGILFAGGVLSYLILIPAIKFFGDGLSSPLLSPTGKLIRDMEPDVVRNHYVLYIGAGAVAMGGLISLIRSLPTIVKAFQRGLRTFLESRREGAAPSVLRTQQDLPIVVVLVGTALLVIGIWILPPLHINLLSAFFIVIFGFFFVTVSSRITGEIGSSSNPISGMVVATLLATCLIFLLLGWTSPADRFMALTTAAIVGVAASNGGTTAQDLKTAFLVGGTPKRQQLSLFVGVLTSSLFIGSTLLLLNRGDTLLVPEEHPGQSLSEVTNETVEQQQFTFQLNQGVLQARKITPQRLSQALWAEGFELREPAAGSPAMLRNVKLSTSITQFGLQPRTPQEVSDLSLQLGDRVSVKLSELGAVAPASTRLLRVGFAREGTEVPNGKYLVDANGAIQYVVDPGIGGRVSQFQGKRLTRYDAPKARLFSLIIDGVLTQRLPLDLVLLGVFIALMLELCGVSSLPFAVGVYLPISTSTPIFVGGLVRYAVDKIRGASQSEAEFSPGVLLSSGYIAGGAIAGVLIAVLAILFPAGLRSLDLTHLSGPIGSFLKAVGESEAPSLLWSNLWGLLLFVALVAYLFRTGMRGESGAQAPGSGRQ